VQPTVSTDPFTTLAGDGHAETRVKASTFIAVAAPAESEAEARGRLEPIQKKRFDATHHCSAWRFRGGVWRANDAGEPSGSAGAPILAAIDGVGVVDCVVVVTRYYGGTKLGVGGLVRAYGDAAALALQAAPRRVGVPAVRLRITYGYEHTAAVMRGVERAGAAEMEHGYAGAGDRGVLDFALPAAAEEALADELREATAGALAPERTGDAVLYRNAGG
jgi:putative IMPACT (imprinted ancient) family translation regulator